MTGRAHALDRVPGLRELAAAQNGIVRRDQLAALGLDRHHIRRQVESERWRTVGSFVVVLHNARLSRAQQLAVAVLHAGPSALLSGRTALEVDGLRGWEAPPVHVLVERGRRVPPLPGLVVHACARLDPRDVSRAAWPPRTTPARAAIDSAALERTPRTAGALVLAVVQQRVASVEDLLDALDRLPRPRHAAALRRALGEAGAGADSQAESDAARLVRRAGLGAPRRQVLVETPYGTWPVDLLVTLPDGRLLALEVDGPHHLDPAQRRKDLARDAALLALGYVVLRIPAYELRRDPARVLGQLKALARVERSAS